MHFQITIDKFFWINDEKITNYFYGSFNDRVKCCASIITGSSQTLTFTSVPESATIEIKNRNGVKVHTGQTPATVSLKKVPVISNQKVIKYLSVNLVIKLKR